MKNSRMNARGIITPRLRSCRGVMPIPIYRVRYNRGRNDSLTNLVKSRMIGRSVYWIGQSRFPA